MENNADKFLQAAETQLSSVQQNLEQKIGELHTSIQSVEKFTEQSSERLEIQLKDLDIHVAEKISEMQKDTNSCQEEINQQLSKPQFLRILQRGK